MRRIMRKGGERVEEDRERSEREKNRDGEETKDKERQENKIM